MNKKILDPESEGEENELIRRLCCDVLPDMKSALKGRISVPWDAPPGAFMDSLGRTNDVISYRDARFISLLKLIHLASNLHISEELGKVLNIKWEDKDAELLISSVRRLFDMQRREMLIVLLYTESTGIKAIYESRSWEMFGCNSDNERLKEYIKHNSPCKLVMIHSHPGTSVKVSDDDVRFTESIAAYAESLDSVLTEHFIIPCANEINAFSGVLARVNGKEKVRSL